MLKYICLSDQHAGALMSLLTPLTQVGIDDVSPVTEAFATALNAMLAQQDDQPQLVMMGDLLDLQFSDRTHATQSALSYLKAINSEGRLAPEMIATAGNQLRPRIRQLHGAGAVFEQRQRRHTLHYICVSRVWF